MDEMKRTTTSSGREEEGSGEEETGSSRGDSEAGAGGGEGSEAGAEGGEGSEAESSAPPIESYCCSTCGFTFSSALSLLNHQVRKRHGDYGGTPSITKKNRKVPTNAERRKALKIYDEYFAKNPTNAITATAKTVGYDRSTLSKWIKKREQIQTACKDGRAKKRRDTMRDPQFCTEEIEVYLKFLYRRFGQGKKVRRRWLRNEMRKLVRVSDNPNAAKFKASDGWLTRFLKRWKITHQCRTNAKHQTVEQRIETIKKFHRQLREIQTSEPRRCEKYGRFPGTHMFHCDQVPIQFTGGDRHSTLNPKGCQSGCRIGSLETDEDKRFATLQVTIRAAESQIVDIELIFAGAGQVSQVELEYYDCIDNLAVTWQSKAYADERTTLQFLQRFRSQTKDLGEVLLGMDNYSAQQTPTCRLVMEYLDIVPVFTPPDCTDCISPVDHHVGRALQTKIAKFYQEAYDKHGDDWFEAGLEAREKRMLLAEWTSRAWREINTECENEEGSNLIHLAFVETGFLLALDGREDHLIRLQGWTGTLGTYSF